MINFFINLVNSQIDLCDYMVNYPDLISLPVNACPIPAASYTFNVKMPFDEIWLDINGEMQVQLTTVNYHSDLFKFISSNIGT